MRRLSLPAELRSVRFHLPSPPHARTFKQIPLEPGSAPRAPVKWNAQVSPPGWVAYRALAPNPRVIGVGELRPQPDSQYDVSFDELTTVWNHYYEPRQGSQHPSVDARMSEYSQIQEAEAAIDPLQGPMQSHGERRNALFDKLLSDSDTSLYVHVRRLDKQTNALVPYEPAIPMKPLSLKDGTQVWMRPLETGDPRGLSQFLLELDDASFRLRFPGAPAQPEERERLAAQLVQDNGGESLKAFVVQDDMGRILGLLDYQRTPRGECEVHLVVCENLKGKCLGARLLHEARLSARHEGYKQMLAIVSDKNAGMQKVLARAGITGGLIHRSAPEHRIYRIELRTPDDLRKELVELVQIRLGARSHRTPITGQLDEATRESLKALQTANGLAANGQLTRETLEKLGIDEAQSRGCDEIAQP
jgi:GNAT superfamily N-acetyltransferase